MRSKQLHNFGKFLQYCMFHMQKLIEVCQSGAQSGTIISDTLAKNKSDQKGWSDLFFFFFTKCYFLCGGIQMYFNSFVLMQRPTLEYFLGTNKIGLKKKKNCRIGQSWKSQNILDSCVHAFISGH